MHGDVSAQRKYALQKEIWQKDAYPVHLSPQPIIDRMDALKDDIGGVEISGRFHTDRNVEDDYDIHKQILGEGYNGTVRLATDKRGGGAGTARQKYAVKSFKIHGLSKDSMINLRNDVEVFLCMDHPHIARLKDVYQKRFSLTLVVECLEGGELLELFERFEEKNKVSEKVVANISMQMLRALSYIHYKNLVHGDIKLQNFLFDAKGSSHLKLIDFGFNRNFRFGVDTKIVGADGTLPYIAPERIDSDEKGAVSADSFRKDYDEKVDIWSIGVAVFVLLLGYMPFSDPKLIRRQYVVDVKPHFSRLSENAKQFIQALLVVDSRKRPTAKEALELPFIRLQDQINDYVLDTEIVVGLRAFAKESQFRRTCMSMLAWSLTNNERASVRKAFVDMDSDKRGVLSLANMKEVLQKYAKDDEIQRIFRTLDVNNDAEVNYTDFLAAMLSTRLNAHDDLISEAFDRFDAHSSGFITADSLTELLSVRLEGATAQSMIAEADFNKDGKISKDEFIRYIKGGCASNGNLAEGVERVIEHELSVRSLSAEQYRASSTLQANFDSVHASTGAGQSSAAPSMSRGYVRIAGIFNGEITTATQHYEVAVPVTQKILSRALSPSLQSFLETAPVATTTASPDAAAGNMSAVAAEEADLDTTAFWPGLLEATALEGVLEINFQKQERIIEKLQQERDRLLQENYALKEQAGQNRFGDRGKGHANQELKSDRMLTEVDDPLPLRSGGFAVGAVADANAREDTSTLHPDENGQGTVLLNCDLLGSIRVGKNVMDVVLPLRGTLPSGVALEATRMLECDTEDCSRLGKGIQPVVLEQIRDMLIEEFPVLAQKRTNVSGLDAEISNAKVSAEHLREEIRSLEQHISEVQSHLEIGDVAEASTPEIAYQSEIKRLTDEVKLLREKTRYVHDVETELDDARREIQRLSLKATIEESKANEILQLRDRNAQMSAFLQQAESTTLRLAEAVRMRDQGSPGLHDAGTQLQLSLQDEVDVVKRMAEHMNGLRLSLK